MILGADALLAARPATPVQLANACLAAGYIAAVPASWGDELIAEAALKRLAARGDEAVVLCSCPRVAERVRRVGSLRPHVLPFVSPPVAAARYLRARAGLAGLHITYVGDCPGAVDPSIDRYATPAALLKSLAKRGIVPAAQPTEMDERKARDGRRFYSLPGGVPAPNWIYAERRGQNVVEPDATDYLAEVAHRIAKRERCVIDLATRLGCACAGAVAGAPWPSARAAVASLEPERAVHEVLDHDVQVDVAAILEPWEGTATDGVTTPPASLAGLAATYDPDSKAPVIRSASASPVPYPQPRSSGPMLAVTMPTPSAPSPAVPPPREGPTGANAIPSREGPTGASMRPPERPTGASMRPPERPTGASMRPPERPTGASVRPTEGPTGASMRLPERPTGASMRPPERPTGASMRPVEGPSGAFSRPSGPSGVIMWPGPERRKWDGVERRTGWVNGRPGGRSEPSTGAPLGEPRTMPARQTHTFIRVPSPTVDRRRMLVLAVVCSALVASATSVATIYFTGDGPVRSPARHTAPPAASAVAPVHDSLPAIDTVTALEPLPAPPRSAIAPDPAALARSRRRRAPRPENAFAVAPRDSATRATVIAPGVAPIPRASGFSSPALPPPTSLTQSPRAATSSRAPDDSAAAAIRSEIDARRHRVDSLAHIVDSLRRARQGGP